jgi:hypothetical protein
MPEGCTKILVGAELARESGLSFNNNVGADDAFASKLGSYRIAVNF